MSDPVVGAVPDPADRRWQDAQSVLDGRPSPGAERRRRRQRTLRVGLIIAASVVAGLIGVLVEVFTGGRLPDADFTTPPLVNDLGWVLLIGGLGLEIVGVAWMVRTGRWGRAWRTPLVNLTRADRKQLLQLIRRGDPVRAGREPVASYLAFRLTEQFPSLLIMGGLVVLETGSALQGNATGVWLLPVLLILLIYAAIMTIRDTRRARRWLDRHGPQQVGA